MGKIIFSIIIPSFKRAHLLKWGLFSLAKQTVPFNFEILVLNEGVKDDTKKICEEFQNELNIRYFFTGQRNEKQLQWRMPGFAINIGAKLAKGEVIIISCPEIFIVDNCLHKMINMVSNNKKLIVNTKGLDDDKGVFLSDIKKAGGKINGPIPHMTELHTQLPFFMAINKEEFVSIGGYDEDFDGYCFDDNDIMDRLKLNGCSLQKIDATIVHLFHPRLNYQDSNIRKLLFKNKELYEKRKGVINRNVGREWGVLDV